VISFGFRYDYSSARLAESEDIPDFLLPLREHVAGLAHLPAQDLRQVLVTEYAAGAGIGWHRDKAVFGEVLAVSLVSSCRLRFRRRRGTGWERRTLDVQPRSFYVLRDAARHEWEHSVPPVETLRYAVTFRTLAMAKDRAAAAH
jgi:alkylated DNA repair dioxygenase AlkB